MSFLTNLIPLPYRILAIALLVAAVWGHGYLKGSESGQEKLDKVTDQIQSERDKQALKTGQTIADDKRKINDTVSVFHQNLAAITDYWMRKPKAAPVVPPGPTAPQGTESRQPDAVLTGPSQAEYDELQQACSVTTAMFNACRDGWISQEK